MLTILQRVKELLIEFYNILHAENSVVPLFEKSMIYQVQFLREQKFTVSLKLI